ncbi:MAG TPA: hypothetical protein VFV54_02390, partial [Thermoanaerobaculia bacterium]|nr:hypothetical protein [Thermoanaerobaculia bacterium]
GFSDRCGEALCSTRALPAGETMFFVALRWPGGSSRRRVVNHPSPEAFSEVGASAASASPAP